MKTLASRLAHALYVRGITPAALARATGKTESAVSQWLSGETKSMRSDSLMASCALLSCNAQWLASGKGPSGLDEWTESDHAAADARLEAESSVFTGFKPQQIPEPVVSPAMGIEAISMALSQMTDDQREAMAGKLASLARAPDSATLKKSISESLGSSPLPPTTQ